MKRRGLALLLLAGCIPQTPSAPVPQTDVAFLQEFTETGHLSLGDWRPNWLGPTDSAITTPPNSADLNCEDPAQVGVSGGELRLTIVASACTAGGRSFTYRSGAVTTANDWLLEFDDPTFVEARIFLPARGADPSLCANFPAFWLNGVATGGISHPRFGELDVMECHSNGKVNWTTHTDAGQISGPEHQWAGWHTYGVLVEKGSASCSSPTPDALRATFFYDGADDGGVELCVAWTGMFVILDNDLRVAEQTGNPAVNPLRVDYVRGWR